MSEEIWIRGQLAIGISFTLSGSGMVAAGKIGKLIRLLEVQKQVLEEEDAEDTEAARIDECPMAVDLHRGADA